MNVRTKSTSAQISSSFSFLRYDGISPCPSAIRWSADSEEGRRFTDWAPSVVIKAPIGERWDAHVEYFGICSQGKEQDSVRHYVSPGLHYLVTENTEVGFRVGWGLNDQSARFFVNAGAGFRF